jgi:hypothetical protein
MAWQYYLQPLSFDPTKTNISREAREEIYDALRERVDGTYRFLSSGIGTEWEVDWDYVDVILAGPIEVERGKEIRVTGYSTSGGGPIIVESLLEFITRLGEEYQRGPGENARFGPVQGLELNPVELAAIDLGITDYASKQSSIINSRVPLRIYWDLCWRAIQYLRYSHLMSPEVAYPRFVRESVRKDTWAEAVEDYYDSSDNVQNTQGRSHLTAYIRGRHSTSSTSFGYQVTTIRKSMEVLVPEIAAYEAGYSAWFYFDSFVDSFPADEVDPVFGQWRLSMGSIGLTREINETENGVKYGLEGLTETGLISLESRMLGTDSSEEDDLNEAEPPDASTVLGSVARRECFITIPVSGSIFNLGSDLRFYGMIGSPSWQYPMVEIDPE